MKTKLTKAQLENMKNDIAMKDVMTRRIGNWWKFSGLVSLLCAAIAYVGFSGSQDSYFIFSGDMAIIISWVCTVCAILLGVFALLSFLSWRNSKKHILKLIEDLKAYR